MLIILLGVLLWAGCNVTKKFSDHEYLLIKNKIETDTKKISKDELAGYYQQEPNKKLFGLFHANIAFYNWGTSGKDTKFKKWLRTKIGSPPVILDTNMVTIARRQMGLYLNNIGYFNSTVTDSIIFKKKKARVIYQVKTTKPYTIKSLNWSISDTQLARFVYLDSSKCQVKRNANYNAYTLDGERTRITTTLLNQGYYRFTSNYIIFQVDSSLNSRQMDITIEILNPVVPSLQDFGMMIESTHKRYKINKVYILPQFDYQKQDTIACDTVAKTYEAPYKGKKSVTYYFLYHDKAKIHQRTIAQNVLIEPESWYNHKDVDQTYSRLSGLQNFKLINIDFSDVKVGKDHLDSYPFQLDTQIKLAKASSQSLSWSTDGTNSAGALGIAANIGYMNRNIFRGAQILKITLSASTQMQAGGGEGGLFNTIEFGANGSLTFPQFLIPIKQEKLPKSFKPKTTLGLGYNFQQKRDPDYTRHILNTSFGYTWIQNPTLSHTLNPIEILLVKVFPSPEFSAKLDSLQDVRFKNQYTDHLIAGLKYTLTFSNQSTTKRKNFFYIRSNFETSGNLLYAVDEIVNAPKNDQGEFTLFNIQYSQFIRPDLDFRFYNQLGKGYSMNYRFYGGIGFSYGNSTVLPFEKAFLAGGANDMRGWRMGDLGPGSFHNDTLSQNFGQLGDMQLQLQAEFRFPIYSFFKGALFTDIGNVWLLNPSPDLPGGTFYFNSFLSQLGVDIGIGFRLDFDFFIFRVDPAIPIRVPSMEGSNKWYFSKLQLKDIIWNFGIGYPF